LGANPLLLRELGRNDKDEDGALTRGLWIIVFAGRIPVSSTVKDLVVG
jgi:hypothetical protein